MYDIVKYIINYKPDILNGLPVTRRSWHSNIVKYIINYKPDILNGLSQSHIGLGILTLHTCDRVAMLQLEICKFLAGDLVS